IFPPTAGAQPSFYALLLPGIVLGSLSLATARDAAYELVREVELAGSHHRTDIAAGAVEGRITIPG
ncbi:phosphoribosylamine--glycine ligase, partial [Micromonospora chalcea]